MMYWRHFGVKGDIIILQDGYTPLVELAESDAICFGSLICKSVTEQREQSLR